MSPSAKYATVRSLLLLCVSLWIAGAPVHGDDVALNRAPAVEANLTPSRFLDPVDPGRLSPRVYNDKDGLPQNTVVSLAFDAQGYLWAGTFDGASRFDGTSWTTVNMPNRTLSNDVRAILPQSDGSIWFGTFSGGLHRLSNNQWTSYTVANSTLPDNQVRSLLETSSSDGQRHVWVATLGGLAEFSGDGFTVFGKESGLPSTEIWSVIACHTFQGAPTIGVATSEGIAMLDGDNWQPVDGPKGQVNCMLESVAASGERTLWVGTENEGIWRFQAGSWTTYGMDDGLPANSVKCFIDARAPDGSTTLVAGTSAGLVRMTGSRWTTIVLVGRDVRTISQAPAETGPTALWLGTTGDGVCCIRSDQWTVIDTSSGLRSNKVRCFLETRSPQGSPIYWIGTAGAGLTSFDGERATTWNQETGFPSNEITAMLETRSRSGSATLWVATDSVGLVKMEGGKQSVLGPSNGLPTERVWSLLATPNPNGSETLWAGTYGGGLVRIDGDQIRVMTTEDGLPSDRIWSLLSTTGRDGNITVWAGTASGGLARYRDGAWRVYNLDSGLPNNGVWCLHETTDANGGRALWVGTDGGGVARLDLGQDGVESDPPSWTIYSDSSNPALPNNIVYGIRETANRSLYLCTNRGVARLTPTVDAASGHPGCSIKTYTTEDGLPSNECTIGASNVDSKGRIWVGTIAGAAVFDPANEVGDTTPKPILIERAALVGRQQELAPGESLAYDQNHLVFEYTLVSLHRGGDTRYRTELKGLDSGSTDWSPDSKSEFPALPEGSYEFKVWGRDYAGNISGPAMITFVIKPAPWRTWWAYLLYAAVGLVAGFGGARLRVKALERRNDVLQAKIAERTTELAEVVEQLRTSQREALSAAKRAQESEQRAVEANRAKSVFLANISHELRTPLNAILGFPQIMAADRSLSAEHLDTLAIIMRSGEHLLGLINDVLSISKIEAGKTTLTEHTFDLKKLLQALEEMIGVRAQSKGLQCLFDVSDDVPRYVVGDEGKLRQVILNLLGNAVKFTDEGGIALRATWDAGHVFFEIEDTGHGIAQNEIGNLFEPFVQTESGRKSTDGTGLGLAISKNFIRLMGGSIAVRSVLGAGTVFSVTVPLPISDGPEESVEPPRVERLAANQPAWRILIADDKIENRLLLAKILRRVDLDIHEAANGREAVDIWRTWRPHLIWMDVRMPVMDGIAATKEILRLQAESTAARTSDGGEDGESNAVIIALTASVFERDRDEIISAGCADFVTKPFREGVIFEKMAEHLGMRFIYETTAESVRQSTRSARRDPVSIEGCAKLPNTLLLELKASMETGDVERANAAIDSITELDSALAGELRRMTRAYRFDDIQRAVEAALNAEQT